MKKSNFNGYGFTLIELMVAIAIISILAGVVLVSASSYQKRAKETAVLQAASSVMSAAIQCELKGNDIATNSLLGQPSSGGGNICAGSSFQWPSLNTPSTSGWNWYTFGAGQPYYLAYNGIDTFVVCPVTFNPWTFGWSDSQNIHIGSCSIQRQN